MYGLITFLLIMNLVIGFLLAWLFQEFWPRQQLSVTPQEIHATPGSPAPVLETTEEPDLTSPTETDAQPQSAHEIMNLLAACSPCASFDVWPHVSRDAIGFTHVETTLPILLAAIPNEVIDFGRSPIDGGPCSVESVLQSLRRAEQDDCQVGIEVLQSSAESVFP
jgi:hypothetical protein